MNRSTASLIEELALEIILTPPNQSEALTSIKKKFEDLAKDTIGASPLIKEAAMAIGKYFEEDHSPEEIIAVLTKTITTLQNLVSEDSNISPTNFPNELHISSGIPISTATENIRSANPDIMNEFISTANEHLSAMDAELFNLEKDAHNEESIQAIFRTFHSIKGVAGFLKLNHIIELAGHTESALEKIREGKKIAIGEVLDTLFDAVDLMKRLVANIRKVIEKGQTLQDEPDFQKILSKIQKLNSEEESKIGEILVQKGIVDTRDVEEAILIQKIEPDGRKIGEILVEQSKAKKEDIAEALKQQKGRTNVKVRDMIRIDLDRVDSLVEMIGELVIAEAMVSKEVESIEETSPKLHQTMGQLNKVVRTLQTLGTQVRMVTMESLFQKMARMTRDLGKKVGKQVIFSSLGDETEIDRRMAEQLHDPLVHMVRNAVDHGIESEEIRRDAGKSLQGKISISAYHAGSHIIIDFQDDGGGLNKEAILKKAQSRALVKASDTLSDEEIYNLIFLPGFSTSTQVTEISGRGVGMDVVKNHIESMQGRITVSSSPESGTKFKIILPLTWAIINGVLVKSGEENYIIPLLSITEFIQPELAMISSFGIRGELITVRGEIMPLLRLNRLLEIHGAKENPEESLVLILQSPDRRFALMVDDVISEQKVVIKSLGEGFRGYQNTEYVAGAAILSDGHICLILNIDELGQLAHALAQEREIA